MLHQNLDSSQIPQFAADLRTTTIENSKNIAKVKENLLKVVDLLSTVVSVIKTHQLMINKEVMTVSA